MVIIWTSNRTGRKEPDVLHQFSSFLQIRILPSEANRKWTIVPTTIGVKGPHVPSLLPSSTDTDDMSGYSSVRIMGLEAWLGTLADRS